MFKFLAIFVILLVVAHGYPAAEEEAKPLQDPLPEKAPETDLEAGEGSDLKPAETFGFGYYPGVRLGYGGYGGWGYRSGYGYWGGYRRGWGYGGYPYAGGYYW